MPHTPPDAFEREIARRMKQAAKRRGMSVNQLADAAGLGRGHMSEILNCNKVPSVRTLRKIADALDVDVRDLLPPTK